MLQLLWIGAGEKSVIQGFLLLSNSRKMARGQLLEGIEAPTRLCGLVSITALSMDKTEKMRYVWA